MAGRCAHSPNPALCPAPGPCVTGACSPTSGCVFTPLPGYCDSFCVTGARCDLASGMCMGGGTPRSCADTDPCTTDSCDPAAMACRNAPTDMDRDGYAANRVGGTVCPRGPDCDDMNPDVHPGATERCNGADDNCDGVIDNGVGCVRPGDTCDRAIPVNMAGRTMDTQTGTTAGFTDDLRDACGGRGADVVYAVAVPASADVLFEALGGSPAADPVLSVRTACGSDPVVCNNNASVASGHTARVYLRPTSTAGTVTYYVTVDMAGDAGPFTLRTVLRTPGLRPAVCATPPGFDISQGGTVYGVYAPGLSQHQSSGCRAGAIATEDVLLLPGTARRRVQVTLFDTNAVVYVRQGSCTGGGALEVACATNRTRAEFTVDLAAGPAWLFADSGANLSASRYVLVVYPQ
ncbi:MAG: putative metal-binding motif-containing protein [Deltaproteobacteria bacterium]|nr:putative metal-binding motif-containing protein [Deltaproteobacteria bacterium]